MSRVPSQRPPSPASPKPARRPTLEKPKPSKAAAAPEEHGWSPEAHEAKAPEPGESAAHLAQQGGEAKEAPEQKQELAEAAEHDERGAPKPGQPQVGGRLPLPRPALLGRKPGDGFLKPGLPQALPRTSSSSYNSLAPVGALQKKQLDGGPARAERPPDAFALLREAKERGVLFTEDATRDGHTEEQDDPELAAAVEQAITLLFGVRGILRIGPGRDDKGAPVIVIVTSQGFGEAALAKVPEKVHRFPTLVAIPFDLLPLRRDR